MHTVYRWPVVIHHATGHVAAKSPQLVQGRDLECTERLQARRLHCDNSLDASPSQIPKCQVLFHFDPFSHFQVCILASLELCHSINEVAVAV